MNTARATALLAAVLALMSVSACQPKHSNQNAVSAPYSPAPAAPITASGAAASSTPAAVAAGCSQPCATGDGLTIQISGADGTVHSIDSDGIAITSAVGCNWI